MDDPTTAGREGFGLMFYQARWYDPGLGRMAQADSIVPGGVQGLDRYAAMFNNPVKYNDPSGHTALCGATCENEDNWSLPFVDSQYGITFDGNGWTAKTKKAVRTAVEHVANAFQQAYNQMCDGWDENCPQISSAAEAFRAVYSAVRFTWGSCDLCNGSGAYAYGPNKSGGYHEIRFASMTGGGGERGAKQVVHELGHIYNGIRGRGPSDDLDNNRSDLRETRYLFLRPNEYEGRWDWQQHPPDMDALGWSGSETFADMFIAWTYNAWNLNVDYAARVAAARSWMNRWLP